MKTKKYYSVLLLWFCSCLFLSFNSYGQLTIDVGNDTTYCADGNTISIPMGLKVDIQNGVEPLTFAWECKIVPFGILKPQTASDVLNDSTMKSPSLIDGVWHYGDNVKFTLHVTDHAGTTAKDNLNVSFSSCVWILGYQVIELVKGDSVWFDAGIPSGSVAAYYWEPYEGLSTPHSATTWCKPTVTTRYDIVRVDTSGCVCSNLAYEIMIIPTSSETMGSSAENTVQAYQKGTKVHFINTKHQEASVSVFSLDGKLLYQCTTNNEDVEVSSVTTKKGVYIVKIFLEGKAGVCRYLKN